MADFDGKVMLVTGGATGLGAAIAVGAARRGAKAVVINCTKSLKEAEATADLVRAAGAEAAIAKGDVAEDADCRSIAASVGPFQMIRACRGLLEAAERSSVLMTSSIAGITGGGSSVAYAATKGALNTMTLSLARALAPKIRVNAICPGFIDTRWFPDAFGAETTERIRQRIIDSTPLKAASKPEDIADAALFLISDAARHITGETLMVDAGLHLGSPPQSGLRR
jgi:NAD(P)-dependent dehydrogenase (short-subunit alcohol dehydrogenase family)